MPMRYDSECSKKTALTTTKQREGDETINVGKLVCRRCRFVGILLAGVAVRSSGAEPPKQEKEPPVVDPGPVGGPPSDAIVLFDGKDLSKFRGERSAEPKWKLADGVMETTPQGGIFSKEEFTDCQLHVEWASPSVVKGEGQGRGNSGVYLMGRYEIQVLDTYNNKTYFNGQCGAFYGHNAPLVNACRKPGEWQAYDIIFHAPKKLADGKVQPGSFTVLHNGVLIQDHIAVGGEPTGAPLGHRRKGAALPPGPRQPGAASAMCGFAPCNRVPIPDSILLSALYVYQRLPPRSVGRLPSGLGNCVQATMCVIGIVLTRGSSETSRSFLCESSPVTGRDVSPECSDRSVC